MRNILTTVNYFNFRGVVHRDLKPENIIVMDDYIKVKGLQAATYVNHSEKRLQEKIGTSYYMAPEVLKRDYNQKCDIWSCGVIAYVLLSG